MKSLLLVQGRSTIWTFGLSVVLRLLREILRLQLGELSGAIGARIKKKKKKRIQLPDFWPESPTQIFQVGRAIPYSRGSWPAFHSKQRVQLSVARIFYITLNGPTGRYPSWYQPSVLKLKMIPNISCGATSSGDPAFLPHTRAHVSMDFFHRAY